MDPIWYQSLISGKSQSLLAGIQRFLLRILTIPYGLAIRSWTVPYDWGWRKPVSVASPVLSLGNLTAGGTGKTPWAAFVARWYRERAYRVAFLSRGYGADPGNVNDEALVLNILCPDVPHLQHRDRLTAANIAIEELESQILILDDGFQHRRLARAADFLLIDMTNPWGYGALLPRGLLREPLTAIRRATLIILTRVDQVTPAAIQSVRKILKQYRGHDDCVESRFPATGLVNSAGDKQTWPPAVSQGAAAFCGIGNPSAFQQTLMSGGIPIPATSFLTFPDHHRYTRQDVERIEAWARQLKATTLLTTVKDLVKLQITHLGDIPLWAVEISTEIVSGGDLLEKALTTVESQIPSDSFWEYDTTFPVI